MKRASAYPSSLAFDWIMGVLSVVLMAGVIQDGWAHAHGLVDQSFLTPWHAVLYGTMVLNGIVLGSMIVINLARGRQLRDALPYGYWMSFAGVIVFAVGGVFDLWWHTRYGIETDINALISPTHIWLALGGALVFCGPIRSVAARYGPQSGGWKITGPAVLSALALLTLIGFFTQYAQPIGDYTEFSVIGQHEAQTGGALYSVRDDGARETRLLTLPGRDIWGAAVSPDGKSIAFRVRAMDGAASDIYLTQVDGSRPRRLTHSGRYDTQPAWSPDGKRIAFISLPAGTSGDYLLQTVRNDGSDLKTLASGTAQKHFPAWSPDGRFIAYETRNGLNTQIAVISSSGGTPRWLDATIGSDQASWSRDGRIAFSRPDGSVGVTDAAGKTARDLVRNAQMPAWAPDGKRIAYVREAAGDSQIFVTNLATGSAVNVSQLAGLDGSRPAWTPAGDLIFTATGRPVPATTFLGLAYSEDANLIEAIAVTGIALLLVRRWRIPFGALTALFGLFAVALAFQSDLYWEIVAAVLAGVAADIAIVFLGERARSGAGFYALGFGIPFVLFALYLIVARIVLHGLGWPPNMIAGSPFLAGFAGLLVAFCFAPPLRSPQTAA